MLFIQIHKIIYVLLLQENRFLDTNITYINQKYNFPWLKPGRFGENGCEIVREKPIQQTFYIVKNQPRLTVSTDPAVVSAESMDFVFNNFFLDSLISSTTQKFKKRVRSRLRRSSKLRTKRLNTPFGRQFGVDSWFPIDKSLCLRRGGDDSPPRTDINDKPERPLDSREKLNRANTPFFENNLRNSENRTTTSLPAQPVSGIQRPNSPQQARYLQHEQVGSFCQTQQNLSIFALLKSRI